MARPYEIEMCGLAETFNWATTTDLGPLISAVQIAGSSPLVAIGSGGSLTAAHALAAFHRKATHQVTAVATPLDATAEPLDSGVAIWLLSASGGNVDILASAEALVMREPRQVAVLCGREDSALASLCREHAFVDLMIYPPPAGKDGFLATNSLLGFTTLIARAYAAAFNGKSDWASAVDFLTPLLAVGSDHIASWEAVTAPLWSRPTTLVLHGPDTRIGAIDLESKFTEAAIGNLQVADYRALPPPRRQQTGSVAAQAFAAGAPLRLPHTDWLLHRLTVIGPAATMVAFRAAAAGAGTIPWRLDLDSLEEDWFHLLVNPAHRALSLAGARVLAGQLREAVEHRHAVAVSRVGHSRACPFDLHALVPVPATVLRLGPDQPDALAWLWQHWGTTQALRHVAPAIGSTRTPAPALAAGKDSFLLSFWAADWTPWRALERIRADWPALRFNLQPHYDPG